MKNKISKIDFKNPKRTNEAGIERDADIRNKLQLSRTILEVLVSGKKPSPGIIKQALNDFDKINEILSDADD